LDLLAPSLGLGIWYLTIVPGSRTQGSRGRGRASQSHSLAHWLRNCPQSLAYISLALASSLEQLIFINTQWIHFFWKEGQEKVIDLYDMSDFQ
jgi:hypothetical protein